MEGGLKKDGWEVASETTSKEVSMPQCSGSDILWGGDDILI